MGGRWPQLGQPGRGQEIDEGFHLVQALIGQPGGGRNCFQVRLVQPREIGALGRQHAGDHFFRIDRRRDGRLFDVGIFPDTQQLVFPVVTRHGHRREAAHADEGARHGARFAVVYRLDGLRRGFLSVGEKDQAQPGIELLHFPQGVMHTHLDMGVRRPGHAPIDVFQHVVDHGKVVTDLQRFEQEMHGLRGKQAKTDLGPAGQFMQGLAYRRLGIAEPVPGQPVDLIVLGVHALGDVEHQLITVHAAGQCPLWPQQAETRQQGGGPQ